jgi:hypothetical protein
VQTLPQRARHLWRADEIGIAGFARRENAEWRTGVMLRPSGTRLTADEQCPSRAPLRRSCSNCSAARAISGRGVIIEQRGVRPLDFSAARRFGRRKSIDSGGTPPYATRHGSRACALRSMPHSRSPDATRPPRLRTAQGQAAAAHSLPQKEPDGIAQLKVIGLQNGHGVGLERYSDSGADDGTVHGGSLERDDRRLERTDVIDIKMFSDLIAAAMRAR